MTRARTKAAYGGFALIALASALAALSGGQTPSGAPREKEFSLDNGLRVFLCEKRDLPLVNIAAAVDAGSKDETDETNGLAHLLEHYVLFRGTETRSGSEIAREIRRHGAYFNARTGQDMTVFELTLPSEHAAFGLANQKEILFNLKIEAGELEAEKDVVLEEMNQIRDDPIRYGFSLLYQNLYRGHPYGRPVYGTIESVKSLTAERVEAFYKSRFVPAATSLAVVGDFALEAMEALVRSCFDGVPKAEVVPSRISPPSPLAKTLEVEVKLDVKEAYLLIGALAPDYNSPDQYAADLLTEILGRGISPMLLRPLKSGRDLIDILSMSYIALKHAGAFAVTMTLDPKKVPAAKSEALKFLRQARGENFSKSDVYGDAQMYAFDFLESSRNQILLKLQEGRESGLNLAVSLAMHILLRDKPEAPDYFKAVRGLTSSDLRKAAAKYFGKTEYVVISIVPGKT
jgi:predicted Zn-dependent peptidase